MKRNPGFQVGVREKAVRSLMSLDSVQRYVPGLAKRLCHPESSVTRHFSIAYHGFTYPGVTRNRIDWCVYYLKNFALAEAYFIESVARHAKRTGKPFICLDVGAHVGHRTLLMAKVADRVIATEPITGAVETIEEKIHVNKLTNVDVFDIALCDHNGELELDIVSPSDFMAVRKNDPMIKGAFGTEVVAAARGDDFIAQQKLPQPSFIRLNSGRDTLKALAGLNTTLRHNHPIMLIECPSVGWGHVIDAEILKDALYDDVVIKSFDESLFDGQFSLDDFDPRARKLVCYPLALERMAQQEASKRIGLGLPVTDRR